MSTPRIVVNSNGMDIHQKTPVDGILKQIIHIIDHIVEFFSRMRARHNVEREVFFLFSKLTLLDRHHDDQCFATGLVTVTLVPCIAIIAEHCLCHPKRPSPLFKEALHPDQNVRMHSRIEQTIDAADPLVSARTLADIRRALALYFRQLSPARRIGNQPLERVSIALGTIRHFGQKSSKREKLLFRRFVRKASLRQTMPSPAPNGAGTSVDAARERSDRAGPANQPLKIPPPHCTSTSNTLTTIIMLDTSR